jgi:hypothetical protein
LYSIYIWIIGVFYLLIVLQSKRDMRLHQCTCVYNMQHLFCFVKLYTCHMLYTHIVSYFFCFVKHSNEFCFSFLFLSEQADKGQLPERTCTAQRSDNHTPAIYMVWRVIIFFSHLLFFFFRKLNMYIFVLVLTNPRTN